MASREQPIFENEIVLQKCISPKHNSSILMGQNLKNFWNVDQTVFKPIIIDHRS